MAETNWREPEEPNRCRWCGEIIAPEELATLKIKTKAYHIKCKKHEPKNRVNKYD